MAENNVNSFQLHWVRTSPQGYTNFEAKNAWGG